MKHYKNIIKTLLYCIVIYTSCRERAAAVSRGTSYLNTKLMQNMVITGNVNKFDAGLGWAGLGWARLG